MTLLGVGILEWGILLVATLGCIIVCALVTDIFYERSLQKENDTETN